MLTLIAGDNVVTERLSQNDNDAAARVCVVCDRGTSVENGESVDDGVERNQNRPARAKLRSALVGRLSRR